MINLDYLKKTTDNDMDVIQSLLEMFKDQVPELKAGMLNALDNKNWNALREAAHKAKNSFQILGMQKESDNLQKLEILCSKEKEAHTYTNYVQQFITACDDSINEIDNGLKLS